MTHLPNYCQDRLAIYTFDRAFNFVQTWTHLRLSQEQPDELANKYFNLYPEEKDPIWLVS